LRQIKDGIRAKRRESARYPSKLSAVLNGLVHDCNDHVSYLFKFPHLHWLVGVAWHVNIGQFIKEVKLWRN